jgi:hypothetical protein
VHQQAGLQLEAQGVLRPPQERPPVVASPGRSSYFDRSNWCGGDKNLFGGFTIELLVHSILLKDGDSGDQLHRQICMPPTVAHEKKMPLVFA